MDPAVGPASIPAPSPRATGDPSAAKRYTAEQSRFKMNLTERSHSPHAASYKITGCTPVSCTHNCKQARPCNFTHARSVCSAMHSTHPLRSFALLAFPVTAAFLVAACASTDPSPTSAAAPTPSPAARPATAILTPPALTDTTPRDYPGLHNVVAYHKGFYSGALPEGPEAFASLRALGVKTIITVDGAEPDVAAAKAQGIRYIHLPIGYNGFDEARKMQLVRATRDAMKDGDVYLHCHHGKHRSAGAAAAISASLGWLSPDEGVARMKVSGTAPNYKGLYACAANSAVLAADAIDAVPARFPEISKPESFVLAMVQIDEVTDHLKLIEKANWLAPQDHPDLVPAAEAGRLADHFRDLLTSKRTAREPQAFVASMRTSHGDAQALEDTLAAPTLDAAKASAQFKLVVASCKDCHSRLRD